MRVGVLFGGTAMGGPPRVTDAVGAFQRGPGDDLFEIAKFAWSAANVQLASPGYAADARGIEAGKLDTPRAPGKLRNLEERSEEHTTEHPSPVLLPPCL